MGSAYVGHVVCACDCVAVGARVLILLCHNCHALSMCVVAEGVCMYGCIRPCAGVSGCTAELQKRLEKEIEAGKQETDSRQGDEADDKAPGEVTRRYVLSLCKEVLLSCTEPIDVLARARVHTGWWMMALLCVSVGGGGYARARACEYVPILLRSYTHTK